MNARATTLLPLYCEIHRSVRALPQVEGYNSPKPHPDSAQLEGGGGGRERECEGYNSPLTHPHSARVEDL